MNVTDVANAPVPQSVLDALKRYDTPTICNAMEIVAPERRLYGFTVRPLVCPFPDLPPIVGYARTATIRAAQTPHLQGAASRGVCLVFLQVLTANGWRSAAAAG